MIRKRLKSVWFRMFAARQLRKIERDLSYRYGDLKLILEPGIFHPKYFKSSQLLLQHVETSDVLGKKVLEMGSGSGITALLATRKGAIVTAVDINPKATEVLIANAERNDLKLEVVTSDLFDSVREEDFEMILINPPFYPKQPRSFAEHAWFCGTEFEYFQKLFHQMNEWNLHSGIFMTLSDDCDLEKIKAIARNNGFEFELKRTARSLFEKNFLFELKSERIN